MVYFVVSSTFCFTTSDFPVQFVLFAAFNPNLLKIISPAVTEITPMKLKEAPEIWTLFSY
jgi:hypothetical protein